MDFVAGDLEVLGDIRITRFQGLCDSQMINGPAQMTVVQRGSGEIEMKRWRNMAALKLDRVMVPSLCKPSSSKAWLPCSKGDNAWSSAHANTLLRHRMRPSHFISGTEDTVQVVERRIHIERGNGAAKSGDFLLLQ